MPVPGWITATWTWITAILTGAARRPAAPRRRRGGRRRELPLSGLAALGLGLAAGPPGLVDPGAPGAPGDARLPPWLGGRLRRPRPGLRPHPARRPQGPPAGDPARRRGPGRRPGHGAHATSSAASTPPERTRTSSRSTSRMPPGVSLDATDRVAQQVEAILSDKTRFPEVKTLFTSVGGGGFGGAGARRTSPSSWRTRSTAPAPCGTSRTRSGAGRGPPGRLPDHQPPQRPGGRGQQRQHPHRRARSGRPRPAGRPVRGRPAPRPGDRGDQQLQPGGAAGAPGLGQPQRPLRPGRDQHHRLPGHAHGHPGLRRHPAAGRSTRPRRTCG